MTSEHPEQVRTDTPPIQSPPIEPGENPSDWAPDEPLDSQEPANPEESCNDDRNTHVQMHSSMAQVVLRALLDGGISVVEYGQQLRFRCRYAEVLIVIEYAVPDHELQPASQILIDNNLPLIPSSWRDKHEGIWAKQSLTHDLDGQNIERVNLLPLSLVGLTLEDTIMAPSTFDRDLYVLTPKPPRYYLSLLRLLLRLPLAEVGRRRVKLEIHIFVAKFIMHGPPAHVPRWVVDAESDESYQQRVEQGIREMKTWDWGEVDERMLDIAERAVRDCNYIDNLTDVVVPPRVDESRNFWDSEEASDGEVEQGRQNPVRED